jgi:hypothetical protein
MLNMNMACLTPLQRVCERLVRSTKESEQRLAAEMLTGISRGCKHWPYADVCTLHVWLTNTLRTAIMNITSACARI